MEHRYDRAASDEFGPYRAIHQTALLGPALRPGPWAVAIFARARCSEEQSDQGRQWVQTGYDDFSRRAIARARRGMGIAL